MIDSLASLKVGEAIYNEIAKSVTGMQPYRYNLTDIKNGGFVFQSQQSDQKNYFGDILQQTYKLYYFSANGNDRHLKQLTIMDNIVKALIALKTITVDNQNYNILKILINNQVNPLYEWVSTNIDTFDADFQVYTLDLVINLYNI